MLKEKTKDYSFFFTKTQLKVNNLTQNNINFNNNIIFYNLMREITFIFHSQLFKICSISYSGCTLTNDKKIKSVVE